MDAMDNGFSDEFDVVTSFNCLHGVGDQRKALRGICQSAKRGAQIILLFP
ncbi:methyltransferase domain-containing protein [Legionella jordanis]|nr:methyltransferase domain-containing protein [Legionella jordanis]RMX15747.1 methyltransferase domain-containing protein [Legionella jordanis]